MTHFLIIIEGVDVHEGSGGELSWEVALKSHRQRHTLLQGRVRLRAFIFVFVIVSHLHQQKTLDSRKYSSKIVHNRLLTSISRPVKA